MEGEGGGQSHMSPATFAACFQKNAWHVLGAQQTVAPLHLLRKLFSIILLMNTGLSITKYYTLLPK